MPIIRTKHFTLTPNDALRDPTLSLQAKGLLAVLLSYPDDWGHDLANLAQQSTNGEHSTRTALAELAAAGYIEGQP